MPAVTQASSASAVQSVAAAEGGEGYRLTLVRSNEGSYSEAFRLECEARHWRAWAREHGKAKWLKAKDRIRKHRGAKGLKRLVDEMNRQERSSMTDERQENQQ